MSDEGGFGHWAWVETTRPGEPSREDVIRYIRALMNRSGIKVEDLEDE